MSWELRLWLPSLPESLRDVDFSKVERRTDLYALGLGDDVGVKRRNGTDLEIKRREKRKKRGAEKWRKTKVETTEEATWMSCDKARAKTTREECGSGGRARRKRGRDERETRVDARGEASERTDE